METYREELEERKRKFIEHDIFHNIFVEAGAGAGKTHMVVKRILNQLAESDMQPEQIVVITFTNAAVNELKSRIQSELKGRIREMRTVRECSDKVRKLENAYSRLERMNICTIHSFCLSMLRERGFDVDMSLDVRLLDEEEAEKRAERFFQQYYQEQRTSDILRKVYPYPYEVLKNTFLAIYSMHDVEFVYRSPDEKPIEDVCQEADEIVRGILEEIVRRVSNGDDTEYKHVDLEWFKKDTRNAFQKYLEMSEEERVKNPETIKILETVIKKREDLFIKRPAKFPEGCVEVIVNYIEGIERQADKLHTEVEWYKHGLVMQYACGAYHAYRNSRKDFCLSNDELLYFAKKLVTENSEAKKFFQRKYRCFYVDEFQDTDPLQTEMILRLAQEDNGRFRDGALFIVGDPKQSIYGFRGADICLYRMVQESFRKADNAEVIYLSDNYRTNAAVIGWINTQFAGQIEDYQKMSPAGGERQAPSDPAVLEGVYRAAAGEGNVYQAAGGRETTAAKVEKDAQTLADLISTLAAENWVYDKKEKKYRRIRYSDIMVLVWTTTYMEVYLDVLHKRNIPIHLQGKYKPDGLEPLRRYTAMVRFLADPYDSLKRAAFLDRTVGADLSKADRAVFWNLDILDKLLEEIKGMKPLAAAETAALHREMYYPSDMQEYEVMESEAELRRMLETMAEKNCGTLAELAEAMEKHLDTQQKKMPMIHQEQDAVQFMNMHQSKGLEAEIVIVADRRENKNIGKGESSFTDRECVPWKAYIPVKAGGNPLYHQQLYCPYTSAQKKDAAKRETEEFCRCEYVEATRAKEALILMPSIDQKGNVPFLEYESSIEQMMEIDRSAQAGGEEVKNVEFGPSSFLPMPGETWEQQKACTYVKKCPSAAEHRSLRINAEGTIPEEETAEDEVRVKERPSGNLFGTVMHRCFELVVNDRKRIFSVDESEREKRFERIIRFAIREEEEKLKQGEKAAYFDYLQQVLRQFYEDNNMRGILEEAKEVFTELPFSYAEETGEGTILHEGVMDLVIKKDDDSWVIVDYKSNNRKEIPEEIFANQLHQRYGQQLEQYKESLCRFLGKEEVQIAVGIYYLS